MRGVVCENVGMEITNMNPAADASRMEKSRKLLILGAVLIVLVAVVWFFGSRANKAVAPESGVGGSAAAPAAPAADLGSTLYNQANNPVSGKMPGSVAPVPNPIQGMYKNPF